MEVTATFMVEDVVDELDLDYDAAVEFLEANGKYIEDAMVRAGFEAIYNLNMTT